MPGEDIQSWSVTASDNGNSDTAINWVEGQPRASVNNSARSMMAAHAKDRNLLNGSIVTGGTANAQTFTSGVTYTAVPTGLRVLLTIGAGLSNTGAVTLNMDGIGAIAVRDQGGIDLVSNMLTAGSKVDLVYDGTVWRLLHATGTRTRRGVLGLKGGKVSDFGFLFTWDEALLCDADGGPAVASRNGSISINGATSGPGAADGVLVGGDISWYAIWGAGVGFSGVVSNANPGVGPTLPAGYTHWCYLATGKFSGVSPFTTIIIRGNKCTFQDQQLIVSGGGSTPWAAIDVSALVPLVATNFMVSGSGTATGIGASGTLLKFSPNTADAVWQFRIDVQDAQNNNCHFNLIAPNVGQALHYGWSTLYGALAATTLDLYLNGYEISNGG